MRRAYSMEGEMRGKDINLTVTAGMSHERSIRAIKEDGSTWPIENMAVSGQVWDMRMEEQLAEIESRVTEEGIIVVRFPEMGLGRYIFVINGVSDDGQVERIMEGYIGYEGPGMEEREIGEIERGGEMIVYIGEEKRKVLFGRNAAWEAKYIQTQAVARALEETNEKLERAEALDKAFSEKMNDFIVPDETTGTWIVAGEDTGKPYKGADGADGQKIRRLIVDSVDKLPSTGDGGTYYYVVNAKYTATMSVDRPIYLYVENAEAHPDGSGLAVNGIDVLVGGFVTLSAWVDIINRDYSFAIKAELINTQWLKLTAVYDGVTVSADSTAPTIMYLQDYYGYEVYGWVNGRGWVNMEMARDLESLPIATAGTTGVVKLANSVTAADPYNGEVPTGPAVVSYVSSKVSGLASKAELSGYATKGEVADLATKEEIKDFATKEELEDVKLDIPDNVVSSNYGTKIIELSETEYSLLESYEQDAYYLTYKD